MSPQDDAVPTKREVMGQLERMLASSVFVVADKQGRLLRFIVEHSYATDAITGKDIAAAMFPSVDPFSSNVRANASWLRQRIEDYYSGPGGSDLVRIELPPGAGYRPKFSYHQKSKAIEWFRKGVVLKGSGGPESLWFANGAFGKAIAADPSYVAAHAARTEVELLEFLVNHVTGILPMNTQRTWFNDPQERLDKWALDPDVWLLHAVVGVEHVLRGSREKADAAFALALRVDSEGTGRSIWYGTYLLLTGSRSEALAIAQAIFNQQPENIWAIIIYGLFLYLTRDFEKADEVLGTMVTFDHAESFHDLVRGLVCLGLERFEPALRYFQKASVIREEEWAFLRRERGFKGPRAERFPGLIILALAKSGDTDEAVRRLALLKKQRFAKPFQLAIAHLAIGESPEAVSLITHAFKYGDIPAMWLRLWPFLDKSGSSAFNRLRENLKGRF